MKILKIINYGVNTDNLRSQKFTADIVVLENTFEVELGWNIAPSLVKVDNEQLIQIDFIQNMKKHEWKGRMNINWLLEYLIL